MCHSYLKLRLALIGLTQRTYDGITTTPEKVLMKGNYMSTELTVANDMGMSLAEAMGVSTSTGGGASIARIAQIHTAKMGEVEFNGKKIKTEVLPIGTYTITQGDDVVYATSITIRVFAQRQQWQRWNADTKVMEKTVMANNLNNDLKDNIGTFNLGRPSGYIKDFQALPEATKELMRSVNRVRIFFGVLTVENPMNEAGEPLDIEMVNVPFVMDVKNTDSLKSIDAAQKKMTVKSLLPIMYTLNMTSDVKSIPTGAQYGVMVAAVGEQVQLTGDDNDTLKGFLDYIEAGNRYILGKWDESNVEALSEEDADLVGQFVDVEGADE